MKTLAILLALQAPTTTLPSTVERAAYIYGRCYAYLSPADKTIINTQLQSKGELVRLFNLGISETKRNPISRNTCITNVDDVRKQLEMFFPRKGG